MTSDELLQLYQKLTLEEQKKFIAKLTQTDSRDCTYASGDTAFTHEIAGHGAACPYCHGRARLHGHSANGRQRFFCGNCRKSFSATTCTVQQHTLKPIDAWKKFYRCTLEYKALRASAKECGVCLRTAFLWRHKILDALQTMMDSVKFDGVTEIGEAFFRLSFKGGHKKSNFEMPRPPRHRGSGSHARGLGNELVCVPAAVNSEGLPLEKFQTRAPLNRRGF